MTTRARRRQTGCNAFTLIELTVVMMIMALTFSLVIPLSENATPSYRLKSAIRIMGSFIESSQAEAIASRRPYAIGYDFDARTFWTVIPIEREVEGDPDKKHWVLEEDNEETYTPSEVLPQNIRFKAIRQASGQELTRGRHIIVFDKLGTKGSHIVVLGIVEEDGREGDSLAVKYNTMTGSLRYGDANLRFYTEGG